MTSAHHPSDTLLIGTNKGLYRAPIDDIDQSNRVLETSAVMRIRRFGTDHFAATRSGLFRSNDHGKTWHNLQVPQKEVFSVLRSPDGKRLYAGTHPAHLYLSTDKGQTWEELRGLQELPSRSSWHTPRHRNEAHVRSLGAHPTAPDRIIAGIEVGGVHVSEDSGKTWTERRDGLHDDVHHVLLLSADEYIASTGNGLYRTQDAGRSWTRLGSNLNHSYFREAFAAGGRIYAAAARSAPPTWGGNKGADAALFESDDRGDTFHPVSYPGQPQDLVLAWTAIDKESEDVLAGTRNGNILKRTKEKWTKIGTVPAAIRSLSIA